MTLRRDIPLSMAVAASLVALALPMGPLVGWIGHAGLILPWLAAVAGAAVLLVVPGRGGVRRQSPPPQPSWARSAP